MTKRIIALLLAIMLLCSTVVVSTNAADSKFIGIEVAYRDGGALKTKQEIFFTDGSCLYATIACLETYTLYTYDKENSAFVRMGQDYKDAASKVDIHPEKKIATATMFGQTMQVQLADVVKEKNDVYLPLAQMAALLKTTIAVKDNVMYFCNSGISLADAAYHYSAKKDLLTVSALAQALYGKKEAKKANLTALGYFAGSIYDKRIKGLENVTGVGNEQNYQRVLAACRADQANYLKTLSSDDLLIEQVAKASDFSGEAVDLLKAQQSRYTVESMALQNLTSTKDPEQFKLPYISLKDWGNIYQSLSRSYAYSQYFTAVVSMQQDKYSMLNAYSAALANAEGSVGFKRALAQLLDQGNNAGLRKILTHTGNTLVQALPQNPVAEYAGDSVPYKEVDKALVESYQREGYTAATAPGTTDIVTLLDMENALVGRYNKYFKTAAIKNKKESENLRLSAIFMLSTLKYAYQLGNAAVKSSTGKTNADFSKKLGNISTRLNLFYRAVQSSEYDTLETVDSLIKNNQQIIEQCEIVKNAKVISFLADSAIGKRLLQNSWLPANALNTDSYETMTFKKDGEVTVKHTDNDSEDSATADCEVIDDNTVEFTVKWSNGSKTKYTISFIDGSEMLKCVFSNANYDRYETLLLDEDELDTGGEKNSLKNLVCDGTWTFSSGLPFAQLEFKEKDKKLETTLVLTNKKKVTEGIDLFFFTDTVGRMVLHIWDDGTQTDILFEKTGKNQLHLYEMDVSKGTLDLNYGTMTKK